MEFVAAYATALRDAVTRSVGHDQWTETMLHDGLSSLALRWERLPAGRRLPFVLSRLERALAEWRGERGSAATRLTLADKPVGGVTLIDVTDDTADRGVVDDQLATSAWEGAGRIRRRRFLVAGGATALAGALALSSRMWSSPRGGVTVAPPPAALPERVWVVPDAVALGALTSRDIGLPFQLTAPAAATIPTLAARPVARAVALLDTAEGVFALGTDGGYLVLDDPDSRYWIPPGVHRGSWVYPNSLTPDGTQAALALGETLVVVDFATGRQRRFTVEGSPITQVAWLPDGRVLYAQGIRSAALAPATGVVRPVPYDVEEIAVGSGPDLIQVDSPTGGIPARLATWLASTTDSQPPGPPTGPLPLGTPGASVALNLPRELRWIGAWEGAGWVRGGSLARVCNASELRMPVGYGQPHFATVVLSLTGEFRGALVHEERDGVSPSTPIIHGWLDDTTVIVRLGDTGYRPLVAWDTTTGALALVSISHSESRIALASVG